MTKHWKRMLGIGLLAAAANTWANEPTQVTQECHLEGIKEKVQCGTLSVPENYANQDGKKININFAVLPAIDRSENLTPLMFLAGGPGQAAVSLAAHIRRNFFEIRKTRDIILVDQRGTGESHPLECDESSDKNVFEMVPEDFNLEELNTCLASLEGDLSQFNSENAIRDFDAVRAALGHEKISLYGGSYGTRAALVYMRLFPDSLEAAVLDSVGPIEVPIGPFGLSAARSFDLLIEHCKASKNCTTAFPELEQEFHAVVKRLNTQPVDMPIAHPRLGEKTTFALTSQKFVSTIFGQLYSMEGRSIIPLIIHQAFLENYAPLIGITAMSEDGQGISMGLIINIVCNEDMPRVSPADLAKDGQNNFNQDISHIVWKLACPVWPQYRPSEAFYQPVTANIPTLILSGDLDPVTPPSNGDKSAATLPNNRHVVSKNSAHIVANTECGVNLVKDFLTTLNPQDLDASCLDKQPAESFMIDINGSL